MSRQACTGVPFALSCGVACALALYAGAAFSLETPWHLGQTDRLMAAPASINTADEKPGPNRVVVAVIDVGVIANHPSLKGNILPGYEMASGRRSPDFSPEENTIACERARPLSYRTHGTEVASLIAGNGAGGVLGVNPFAKILPVRVFRACENSSRQDLLDAISWAAGLPLTNVPSNTNPAHVINLSIVTGRPECGEDLQRVIDYAIGKNIFIVAAAGNSFHKNLQEPASCKGVISVGALDAKNRIADYSALDPRTVLYAPGGGVSLEGNEHWSDNKLKVAGYDNGLFGQLQPSSSYGVGTSFSAPLVSGFISLWLSRFPEKTPRDFAKEVANFSRQVERPVSCPACQPRGLSGFAAVVPAN